MTKSAIIIPARYASTRLPQKLLLNETGKPVIQHTYEAAQKATLPTFIAVACDHPKIAEAVQSFGGAVFMTDVNAKSGTDRIAEVALRRDDDIIVNVQGDEPEITGQAIDLCVQMLLDKPNAVMSTLASPIRNKETLEDPSCVKVVFDIHHRAMYFSRSVIPYPRDGQRDESLRQYLQQNPPLFYHHHGLYAYRRDFLLSLSKMPQSDCEKAESLEQLRVLYHGYEIQVGVIDEPLIGIDTPEDYRRFVIKYGKAV